MKVDEASQQGAAIVDELQALVEVDKEPGILGFPNTFSQLLLTNAVLLSLVL